MRPQRRRDQTGHDRQLAAWAVCSMSTRLAGGVMHHAGGAPGHRITTMIGQLDDGFSTELRRWTYCRIGPHPELPVKRAPY